MFCNMKYMCQTSNPRHLRIKLHSSKIKNYYSSLTCNGNIEFTHINETCFENVTISVLVTVKSSIDRLYCENLYILLIKHRFFMV